MPKVATYSSVPVKQHNGAPASASSNSPFKLSPTILSPITSLHGVTWQPIGPDPIDAGRSTFWNGRVNSIAINPNSPNQIYIGRTGAGVWKTNDAGAHWTPLTDHEPMLAIGEPGAVALDPKNTNTIYVGSSSQVNNSTGAQGVALNPTLGILKSTDGGGSWITLGSGFPSNNTGNASQFVGTDIYAIIVDPANSNIVYLAGSLGLWTSSDGGQNWVKGTNGGVGTAQTLVLDPSSAPGSRVLYAGVNSSGVRKTSDGGATWTQVLSSPTGVVATRLTAHNTLTSNASFGKVAVTLAPVGCQPRRLAAHLHHDRRARRGFRSHSVHADPGHLREHRRRLDLDLRNSGTPCNANAFTPIRSPPIRGLRATAALTSSTGAAPTNFAPPTPALRSPMSPTAYTLTATPGRSSRRLRRPRSYTAAMTAVSGAASTRARVGPVRAAALRRRSTAAAYRARSSTTWTSSAMRPPAFHWARCRTTARSSGPAVRPGSIRPAATA